MNVLTRKLFPVMILSIGLTACGGGGGGGDGDTSTDSGFSAVSSHFQRDGLWLLDAVFTFDVEHTETSGSGESVTGQTSGTMNMIMQQVVSYTDDNHIAIKTCDTPEPMEISLNEIEQRNYFSDNAALSEYCPTETHSFEAVSDNQFRIQIQCGDKASGTINLTRISDTPEFNAGSLSFTKMDGTTELTPLDATTGVCGSIRRISATVDYPDGNALGYADYDMKTTDIDIGVLDYLGKPLLLSLHFGFNPVETADYSVSYGTNAYIVSVRMQEHASDALLSGNGGQLTVTEVLDDSITGSFDMTLIKLEDAPTGPLPSYTYNGNFSLDLDPS